MRVGIIAEGRGDLAVLRNILQGALGLDPDDVQFLRPEYDLDATDLHAMREDQFSNWGHVRAECLDRAKIRAFVEGPVDEARLVVIHLDTAEAGQANYPVERPDRGAPGYADVLRGRVVAVIDAWLGGEFAAVVRHAVAVEETEAWVLTLHLDDDTSRLPRPKERLKSELQRRLDDRERKRLSQMGEFQRSDRLSKDFRRAKTLTGCAARNASLRAFLSALATPH
jgi:hypothetical protein